MKIYLVVFEWSTEIDSDVDIEAFDSYEKAAMRFQERINDEKTDMAWIQDAFDECQPDTRLETYAYWRIIDSCNSRMHEYIAIVPEGVK